MCAPVLLCSVALAHLIGADALGASAWEAGSFGMFSSIDQALYRTARVQLTVDGLPVAVDVRHRALARLLRPSVDTPIEDNLKGAAQALSTLSWHRSKIGTLLPAPPDTSVTDGRARVQVQRIRVEVWTVRYSRADRTARPALLGAWEQAAGGP